MFHWCWRACVCAIVHRDEFRYRIDIMNNGFLLWIKFTPFRISSIWRSIEFDTLNYCNPLPCSWFFFHFPSSFFCWLFHPLWRFSFHWPIDSGFCTVLNKNRLVIDFTKSNVILFTYSNSKMFSLCEMLIAHPSSTEPWTLNEIEMACTGSAVYSILEKKERRLI